MIKEQDKLICPNNLFLDDYKFSLDIANPFELREYQSQRNVINQRATNLFQNLEITR